jgi:hypothetical protein
MKDKHGSSRRFVIWSIKDQNAVCIADGPIDVRDFESHFLGGCFERRCPFGRLTNALDALLRELESSDKGCHEMLLVEKTRIGLWLARLSRPSNIAIWRFADLDSALFQYQ